MVASIYQLPTQLVGTVRVEPNFKYMVVGDSLATITATGYLNQIDLQSTPVSPTDVLQVLYNYSGTANSGTFGVFSVTVVNGIITLNSLSRGSTVSVILSPAQIAAAYATPVLLTEAPGAGKVYLVSHAFIYTSVSSVFTGGGPAIVQYGPIVHGGGTNALSATIPAAEITAVSSQIYNSDGIAAGSIITGITNQGLYFSNATGAFAGGAGSSVAITLQLSTINAYV